MPTQRRSVEATITSNCYLSDLHHADGRTFRLAELRLWVTVFIGAPGGQQKRLQFLLDSGAPVSFIPYREWNRLGLKWEKLVRWTRSTPPQVRPEEAFGAPCDLGLVDVWLPHRSDLSDLRGPFSMNAKFERDPGPAPRAARLPTHPVLGLDFFAQHRAELEFACPMALQADAGTVEIA